MHVNEILSPEMRVEPLKPGETRDFVLVNAGVFDPSVGRLVNPKDYGMAPYCMVYDKFDKKNPHKLIMNLVGMVPKVIEGGKTFFSPEVAYIHFIDTGRITSNEDDFNRYCYLKRHNKNRDNPYRNTKAEVKFYEYDERKDAIVAKSAFEYRTLAAMLLMDTNTAKLLEIARELNKRALTQIDLNKDIDVIQAALTGFLQGNALTFIQVHGDERANLRIKLAFAIAEKILLLDEDKNQWRWNRAVGESGSKVICEFIPGNTPILALVDFLLVNESGASHLAELKAREKEYYASA